jgi:hypothetical protein
MKRHFNLFFWIGIGWVILLAFYTETLLGFLIGAVVGSLAGPLGFLIGGIFGMIAQYLV